MQTLSFFLTAMLLAVPQPSPRERIDTFLDTNLKEWRFCLGEVDGAEQPDFNDSSWEQVSTGHCWFPHDSTCWLRTQIQVPDFIMGFPTKGKRVRLLCGIDNEGIAYINGEKKGQFIWGDGDIVLTEQGNPGETITVALYGINRAGYGKFIHAYIGTDESLQVYRTLKEVLDNIDLIETHLTEQDTAWRTAIQEVYETVDFDRIFDQSMESEKRLELALSALSEANGILLKVTQSVPERLSALEKGQDQLENMLEEGRSKDLAMDYVRVKARVLRSFNEYAREDYAKEGFWMKARAERTVAYLEGLTREALREAGDILAHPDTDRPVPRYRTGEVTIRDGAFWQGDRPVYFDGMGHFGQVREDIPIFQEYGMNVIQIEIGPSSIIMEDGSVKLDPLKESILKYLEQAEQYNVAACVLLSPHYFPSWAMKKYPELAEAGHGFMGYDIDHPVAREIIEKFLRAVVPEMARYKSLHSFCLSNEPEYVSRTEVSAKLFHEWLRNRHGSIEKLNALYGTYYDRFEDVPQATREFCDPAFVDWCEFNQERFCGWHKWMADIIHECAPDIPVHAKSMAHSWRGWEQFELGVNHEEFAHIGRVTGNDCFAQPTRERDYPYAQHWIVQAMHYGFQRGVAPDQPIFNTENHLIPDDIAVFTPGEHIYTALWEGAIQGLGASTIWVWQRGEGKSLFDNILTRPGCVEAAGRVGLDLMRLSPLVARLANVPPQIGLFHAWHSNVRTNDTRDASTMAYEGLANLGVPIRIVTEKTISQGALNDLAIAVAAKTDWIHPETAPLFADFVSKGGILFVIEPCFSRDHYGRVNPELSAWMDEAEQTGRIIRVDTPLTAMAIRDLVGERLKATGRGTPVPLVDAHGDSLWGVQWRVLDDGDRYVVNMVNQRRSPQTIRLSLRSGAILTDLISGESFRNPYELAPLRPMLLEIKKADLARLVPAREPIF
ncbi:MAG TPA: beta-galactosidase [bacterium]|nr:beta-galactosidase [bacterium]HQP98346.1 beta-galactosidase [bacterium]